MIAIATDHHMVTFYALHRIRYRGLKFCKNFWAQITWDLLKIVEIFLFACAIISKFLFFSFFLLSLVYAPCILSSFHFTFILLLFFVDFSCISNVILNIFHLLVANGAICKSEAKKRERYNRPDMKWNYFGNAEHSLHTLLLLLMCLKNMQTVSHSFLYISFQSGMRMNICTWNMRVPWANRIISTFGFSGHQVPREQWSLQPPQHQ